MRDRIERIVDSTRDSVVVVIEKSMSSGLEQAALGTAVRKAAAFSDEAAASIARAALLDTFNAVSVDAYRVDRDDHYQPQGGGKASNGERPIHIEVPPPTVMFAEGAIQYHAAPVTVEAPPPADVKVEIHQPSAKRKVVRNAKGELTGIEDA